jgi:hypothetical protein
MKLIKSIFVLFAVLAITACSSDNNTNTYELNNANLSAGTFDLNYLSFSNTETININGLDIITETLATGETFQAGLTFSEDGTYIFDGEYVIVATITVNNVITEELTEIIVVDNEQGTYGANDTLMQIVLDGDTYTVTLFNANELRMTSNDSYTEGDIDYVSSSEIRMIR